MSTKKKSISTRRTGTRAVDTDHPSAGQPMIDAIRMSYEVESAGPAVVEAPNAKPQAPSIEPHTPAIPIVPAIPCGRCGKLHHLGAPTYATLGAVMIGEDGAAVTERVMRVCLGGCIFAHLDQMREALGAHAQQYPEQKIVDTVLPGPAAKVGGMVPNAKSA